MTRRATAITIFLVFLLIFLVHWITLNFIARSSRTEIFPEVLDVIQNEQSALPQQIRCDRSHYRYDLCSINGPAVLNPTTSTLNLVNPTGSTPPWEEKIRPYPRKWENGTMSSIKEFTLIASPADNNNHCDHQHSSPALVFSTGGFTGNPYHDFDDGFIPLFITTRSILHYRFPVLVITNTHDWWLHKYAEILRQFSPYPIINLDTESSTHCFPSATIGLISHGYMTIDPKLQPNSTTFLTFRALLNQAYLQTTNRAPWSFLWKPRLVLVNRPSGIGRVLLNQAEVIIAAEEIGFQVEVFRPNLNTSMSEAYVLINTSHAMLGVHGAAQTHLLFLRPGSVFIQIIPIGTDWLAETCYGKPAKEIGVEYMKYEISVHESTLIDKYGKDHLVLTDPGAVVKEDFSNTKKIYLKNQDVKVDLVRFGRYLRQAYKKAMRFMSREG